MDESVTPEVAERLRRQRVLNRVAWYAVRVQLGHEMQVYDYLMNLDSKARKRGASTLEALASVPLGSCRMECFVPVETQRRKYSDRVVWKLRVLTPSVIFVRTSLSARDELFASPISMYVKHFICNRERHEPEPIPDKQMSAFRALIESHYGFEFFMDGFAPGQRVLITSGEMAGQIAEIEKKEVHKFVPGMTRGSVKLFVRLTHMLGASFQVDASEVMLALCDEDDKANDQAGSRKVPTKHP